MGVHHPGQPLEAGFRYASDNNSSWLTVEDLREMVAEVEAAAQPSRLRTAFTPCPR